MNNLLIFPLLFILSLPAVAQNWVTIPDANFANKLNDLFPECMDGNQMNTECPDVFNATNIDVGYSGISNLTGIQYFANLQYLSCGNNQLSSLPELPSTVMHLDCGYNNLTSLPGLTFFLTYLNCSFNELSALPNLPPNLEFLGCGGNQLTTLPTLPFSLTNLLCSENLLTSLPALPSSLAELSCGDNQLTALPELPESIYAVVCAGNQLTTLPTLPPSVEVLICQNNNLTCLPELPTAISSEAFSIGENPFTCLPNYVPAMSGGNAYWLSYPLCELSDLENNPYGCTSFAGIGGTVFEDLNSNCQENATENGVINASIKLFNDDEELVASTTTLGGGVNTVFSFEADTGNYSVQLVTENMPYQTSCDVPGNSQVVALTMNEPSDLTVDFGVECLTGYEIGTQSVTTSGWVFPGQEHTLNILAGDLSAWYGLSCAEGVSGSVTVNITGPVSYLGPEVGALVPLVSGEIQLTYDIPDFGDVDFQNAFRVILETDTTAQDDELVCIEIIVEPMDDDTNPSNNIITHCYPVVNSYDPNAKQVWPQNVEAGFDGYFNYTIYFQNTGTAPAFNIRVADTLDTKLGMNTFEVTGYSHDCLTYVSGNVATFRFNNIMLPDSTSDFEGSIGYVQYRIKAVADLPVGTVIENTAHIYFDFNEAIVTNTTENEFVITTSAADHLIHNVRVFPNPGTGLYSISIDQSNSPTLIEVYNLGGEKLYIENIKHQRHDLDLSALPSGMYILCIRNDHGTKAIKLIKQ